MAQEEKQLLLKDLCARFPYGAKVFYEYVDDLNKKTYGYTLTLNTWCINELVAEKAIVKPYLRPLSSMTEEEKEELKQISNNYLDEWENTKTSLERWKLDAKESYKRAVFYNSHHFDWNDLISKGLAIEVTKENNPYKE